MEAGLTIENEVVALQAESQREVHPKRDALGGDEVGGRHAPLEGFCT